MRLQKKIVCDYNANISRLCLIIRADNPTNTLYQSSRHVIVAPFIIRYFFIYWGKCNKSKYLYKRGLYSWELVTIAKLVY